VALAKGADFVEKYSGLLETDRLLLCCDEEGDNELTNESAVLQRIREALGED